MVSGLATVMKNKRIITKSLNKQILLTAIRVLFIALIAVTTFLSCRKKEEEIDVFEQIRLSPCAKFESSEHPENVLYITSEIMILFPSLAIVEEEGEIGEWLYRITFNCKELYQGDHEIVVIIGSQGMSIDGVRYSSAKGASYDEIINVFEVKYKYFSREEM